MTIPLSKRWAFVLVASLAINLFLIGAVVAGLTMRGPGGPFRTAPPSLQGGLSSFSMPFAMRVLGPEVRPLARDTFRQHRRAFRSNREALIQGREQALRLLGAPNFKRTEFQTALDDLQRSEARARMAVYGSVAELAEKLTGEQRTRLATAIKDREARRIKHRQERRRRVREKRGDFDRGAQP